MLEVSFSSSFKRAFKKRIQRNVDLEARFYDDLENMLAKYFVDRGQYIAVI